jgi:hypothetical protein
MRCRGPPRGPTPRSCTTSCTCERARSPASSAPGGTTAPTGRPSSVATTPSSSRWECFHACQARGGACQQPTTLGACASKASSGTAAARLTLRLGGCRRQVAVAGGLLAGGDAELQSRVRAGEAWDARALVRLCSESARAGGDAAAAEWCRRVVNVQLRLLFDHVWAKMSA